MLKHKIEKIENHMVTHKPVCVVMPGQTKKEAMGNLGLKKRKNVVYLLVIGK